MSEDRLTGIEMIADERARQMAEEGWTAEHDDEHDDFALSQAAVAYAQHALQVGTPPDAPYWMGDDDGPTPAADLFPWSLDWWKPSPDPIRNLVKAGALIAAEIDRLQRARTRTKPPQLSHEFIPYLANPDICSVCGAVKPMPCYAIGPS